MVRATFRPAPPGRAARPRTTGNMGLRSPGSDDMAPRSPWLTAATALALAVAVGCSRHKPAGPEADTPEGPPPGVQPPASTPPHPGGQAQPGAETHPGVQAQPVTGQVLVEGR